MNGVLTRHPEIGIVFAVVPPWLLDAEAWLRLLGVVIALAIGGYTLALKIREWRRGR